MSRPRPQPASSRATAGRPARLSARDYKSPHNRPLELRRLREFGYGLLAGALLTALAFTWVGNRHRIADTPDAPRPDPHRNARTAADTAAAGGQPAQKYDFYQMLPNFEVVVPEKDKDVKRDLPAAAKIERPGVYVLQAGSYRNETDADRVRAQLALQGIDAKVQRVAVDADVWHRVRIGPISNLDELNKLRRQLQAADVDALVIRVGD
ncbi:MAG: SPOR domain-containing protein [Gammaproteobacteria bacterium]|nr:SPOR domain-containing protein [Gammaproteobacteria bacterium]